VFLAAKSEEKELLEASLADCPFLIGCLVSPDGLIGCLV